MNGECSDHPLDTTEGMVFLFPPSQPADARKTPGRKTMNGKGLVHIYTGEGKGKTTAALGLAFRAAGMGRRVLVVQFFKEDDAPSGEKNIIRAIASRGDFSIELVRSNRRHPMFTGRDTDTELVRRSVADTFSGARQKALAGAVDVLVLDEALSAVNGGWLPVNDVLAFLDERPEGCEVVMTGRNAPVELVQAADYVTEMLKIKHPFDAGVPAREGIEY